MKFFNKSFESMELTFNDVLDTAHWYQKTMLNSIKKFRSNISKDAILIAWNLMTSKATEDFIKAWTNWVKVWIWPWAMCTTRMMTWVWRPQFSAILDCAKKAKELWWFVIWDWRKKD